MITEFLLAIAVTMPSDTTKHHSVLHNVLHDIVAIAPLALSATALYIVIKDRPKQLVCTQTLTVVPPVVGQPYGAQAIATCQ
jgi:hypothetical protein